MDPHVFGGVTVLFEDKSNVALADFWPGLELDTSSVVFWVVGSLIDEETHNYKQMLNSVFQRSSTLSTSTLQKLEPFA